jgi:hypothetical protein
MSNASLINIQKVDVKNLELQFPKGESSNKNGFFVRVRHNKTTLRAVLPDVISPYGAGPQKDFGNKYSMGICFDGMEKDDSNGKKIKVAYKTLEAIQERLKGLVLENREAFFADAGKPKRKTDKPLSDDTIESRYRIFLRPREDRTDIMYLSLQRCRVKKEEEDTLTQEEKDAITRRFSSLKNYPLLVDHEGHVLEVTTDNLREVIPPGSVVRPIIELSYLWVSTSSKTVQPVWTFIHGARMSIGPSKVFDILHQDDDDEEENAMDVEPSAHKIEEGATDEGAGEEGAEEAPEEQDEEEEMAK